MKETKKFQSTLSLLYFLASHKLFKFNFDLYYGRGDFSFEWEIYGIEDQVLLSNEDFNSDLYDFFYHGIILENNSHGDSFTIQPLIIDKQLVFSLSSSINKSNPELYSKDEELPFSNYVENFGKDNLLPLLNNLLKTDQLTSANFDDFIKFSCDTDCEGDCEIFERKLKTWLDADDFENGEAIRVALNDFYYDSICKDFDEDQEPEVSKNRIMFYGREYLEEREMVVEEDLSVFEDEINYVLTIEDPIPIN